MMLILGLFSVVVVVVCVCVCFVMFIVKSDKKKKTIITPFAMREFSVFKFSGYNLENMKKNQQKTKKKNPLEIQHPNSKNSRLDFIESVHER